MKLKLSQSTANRLILAGFMILIATIVFLSVALSQAWENERFQDRLLNGYTTYGTNK